MLSSGKARNYIPFHVVWPFSKDFLDKAPDGFRVVPPAFERKRHHRISREVNLVQGEYCQPNKRWESEMKVGYIISIPRIHGRGHGKS